MQFPSDSDYVGIRASLRRCSKALVVFAVLSAATPIRAELRPRVKVSMPPETAMAVSGQAYSGTIELAAGRPGTVTEFTLSGDGWTDLRYSVPGEIDLQQGQTWTVDLQATPADADSPIEIRFRFNGHAVRKRFELGPEYFQRVSRPRRGVAIRGATAAPARAKADGDDDRAGDEEDGFGQRGGRDIRIRCQIGYFRDDDGNGTGEEWETFVGADRVWLEIRDDDPIGYDTLWEGYTNADGTIDTIVNWDSGDDPDIYLYWATSTDWVDVEEPGTFEYDYSWETEILVEDFDGTEIDLGTFGPAGPADYPALHILNSVVRAHRFIVSRDGTDVVHIDAQWPDDDEGISYYDGELHITTDAQWREPTHVHEFGHHFMEHYSQNPDPDYCNSDGYCDFDNGVPGCYDDALGFCGHCGWCPENASVAWTEGWPNWLADVVLRSFPDDYEGYQPLFTRSYEFLLACCQDNSRGDPLRTENWVSALLHDIDDGDPSLDEESDPAQDDFDGDGFGDSLRLGVDEIFEVVRIDQPVGVIAFRDAFRARFPEHDCRLWRTCREVAIEYTWPDDDPPGVVPFLDSPSHPLGVGGTWPIITIEWDHAPDPTTCGWEYSIVWDVVPVEPDTFAEVFGETTAKSPPFNVGFYYVSIRAADVFGNWSDEWVSQGPFAITECNSNGIIDLCETNCDAMPGFCDLLEGCGAASDCNGNGAPDECDLADGTSKDCDADGVPDECQSNDFVAWIGASGYWDQPEHWEGGELPGPDDYACIDVPDVASVTHRFGTNAIHAFTCAEEFELTGGELATAADSTVREGYRQTGGVFRSDADLTLLKNAELAGGIMRGAGATYARADVFLGSFNLRDDRRALILDGDTSFSRDNGSLYVDGNDSVVTNRGTIDFSRPGGRIYAARRSAALVNEGTIRKTSADLGTIGIACVNLGDITIENGTLRIANEPLDQRADILGDDGTLLDLYYLGNDAHMLAEGSQTFLAALKTRADTVVEGELLVTDETEVSVGDLRLNPAATVYSLGRSLVIRSGALYNDSGGDLSVEQYTQAGGSLRGSGAVTVSGPTTISYGYLGDTVVFTAEGDVTFEHGYWLSPGQSVFHNLQYAAFTRDNGVLYMDDETEFNNLGEVDLAAADVALYRYGGDPQFNNFGLLRKSGPDQATISVRFNNFGEIQLERDVLQFGGAGLNCTGEIHGADGTTLELLYTTASHSLANASSIDVARLYVSGDTTVDGGLRVRESSEFAANTIRFGATSTLTSLGQSLTIRDAELYNESGQDIAVEEYVQTGGYLRGSGNFTVSGVSKFSNGRIGDTVVFNARGEVEIEHGFWLSPGESVFNNHGIATFLRDNGFIYMHDDTAFNNDGEVRLAARRNTIHRAGGEPQFNNRGLLVKSGGERSEVSVRFINTGTVRVENGILRWSAYPVNFRQTDGRTLLAGGEIEALYSPLELAGGELAGSGRISGSVENSGATVSPGESAGIIEIVGDFEQGPNGTLAIEIGGYVQGTEFDLLRITGQNDSATLDGTLSVALINDFVPKVGDRFEILAADALSGTFSQIVTSPPELIVQAIYESSRVLIEVIEAPPEDDRERGDLNCDGSVDFNDIDPFVTALIGREEYESQYPTCEWTNADVNQDGSVDFNDIDGFVECLINSGCP